MKAQDVIGQFRRFVADAQKTRYADDAVPLAYLKAGLEAMWRSRRHRHHFYVARIVNEMPAVAKASDEIELTEGGGEKLAHYMAHLSFMEDSEDATNANQASAHLALFNA